VTAPTPPPSPRRRLLETSEGTNLGEFGAAEWSLLATVAGIWGASFLFIEIALRAFEPGLVAFARIALGTAAIALVKRARRPVEREDWPRFVVLGFLWMALPMLLFPVAQQWITSSMAGMINGSTPLFSALVATVLLRRLPGSRQAVGLVLGLLGVLAIGWPAVVASGVGGGDRWETAAGVALILLASLCYGLSTNLAVPLQQRYGALPVLLRVQLVSVVLVAPFGLAALPGSRFAWESALAIVALGVLGTGWAYVAMVTLVGRVGATRGTVAVYVIPVVAIGLGVVFLDERVAPLALAGTALVLVGAWLVSRRRG
jgi:drug/metabolite transporter (DMT)-like permease